MKKTSSSFIRAFLVAALVLLVPWASPLAAQDPPEEDVPLTEQELLELETEVDAEVEAIPPDVPVGPSEQPAYPAVPLSPRRTYLPRPPAPGVDPALGKPEAGNELVPGTIEVTEVRNVSFFDGQISVDFKNVPAGQALEEIGQIAGFKVVTDEVFKSKPLSVRFNNQPLEKGLTRIIRLLEAGNYRYYYTDEGLLESVVVTATAQPLATQPAPGTPPTGTRRPTVSRRRPTTARGATVPTQETPGISRRSNVVRRPVVTPERPSTAPRQGDSVTPPGIPATAEP